MPNNFALPEAAAAISQINISAGTTSNNLTNLVFADNGSVSFGLDGSTITASVAAGGGGITNIRLSAGTTSNLASAFTFSNSNGISFGLDAGTITGSHNGLTSQSNQAASAANGSFTFQTISFSNVNGVSFATAAGSAIQASIATSLSNIRISAGTTSNLLSAITFADSNGISFGLDASTVTASHNGLTTQTNQQMTIFATGNTTQASSNTTNASSLIFRGAGVASVGVSAGSIVISSPAAAAGSINISAGTTSNDLTNLVFSNSNNVSFGLDGSTITASATVATSLTNIRVSAGTTSNLLSAITFSNGSGVSFGLNASVITASVSAPATISFQNLVPYQSFGALQWGNGSFFVIPMEVEEHLAVSRVNILITATVSSSTNSSHGGTLSILAGIYTRNASTLSRLTLGSGTTAWTNTSNNSMASLSRIHRANATFNSIILTPGDYWIAIGSRTSTVNANWITLSNICLSGPNSVFDGEFGAASAESEHIVLGQGLFTATSTAAPASMAFSDIYGSSIANRSIPICNLANFDI